MFVIKYFSPTFFPLFLFSTSAVATANVSTAEIWKDEAVNLLSVQTQVQKQALKKYNYRSLSANFSALKSAMSMAPLEYTSAPLTYMDLPLPNGQMQKFSIEQSPVMAPGLAKKFPEFKTFRVRSVGDENITGRVDYVSTGFHAYLNTDEGVVFIDPEPGSTSQYRSYYKSDVPRTKNNYLHCSVKTTSTMSLFAGIQKMSPVSRSQALSSNALLTYRLAVATTREYSLSVAGGNVTNTQAAIVTAINRVNEIFERDLAIRLQLIANNDLLISSDTQDLSNDDATLLIDESTLFINDILGGDSSYDIGHVFSTGAGGLATLGSTCGPYKAEGVTGIPDPTGDAFYIDFVAHEIGHQLNAEHTFNGTTSNCGGGNRSAAFAVEPGSGSSIMAYAGICDNEDVQSNSDDTFHGVSISQIYNFTRTGSGGSCDVLTTTGNVAPQVDAGSDYTIPKQTPFKLTGSASDADTSQGNLLYQWDQMDAGAETNFLSYGSDLGSNALFRSFRPQATAIRTLPQMATIISGFNDDAEKLPDLARTMNFRLTVRDQSSGVNEDDMQVFVDADSGPFEVLSLASGGILNVNQVQVIEWNPACTEVAPVSCANVDILLSTDGGVSFDTTLIASTPNDGEAEIAFPDISSTSALIKLACSDNIFFDINNSVFSLAQGSGDVLSSTGAGGTKTSCETPANTPISSDSSGGMLSPFLLALLMSFRYLRRYTFNLHTLKSLM